MIECIIPADCEHVGVRAVGPAFLPLTLPTGKPVVSVQAEATQLGAIRFDDRTMVLLILSLDGGALHMAFRAEEARALAATLLHTADEVDQQGGGL